MDERLAAWVQKYVCGRERIQEPSDAERPLYKRNLPQE
jgi:hypothetical protein